jgi:hypothetical protein
MTNMIKEPISLDKNGIRKYGCSVWWLGGLTAESALSNHLANLPSARGTIDIHG